MEQDKIDEMHARAIFDSVCSDLEMDELKKVFGGIFAETGKIISEHGCEGKILRDEHASAYKTAQMPYDNR